MKIKKIVLLLGLFLCFGCTIMVTSTTNDISLLIQNDSKEQIRLSSLNSAQQINITKYQLKGDTLEIDYKRGIFASVNNVVPLNNDTKFLKCANVLYKIELIEGQYMLTKM